MVFVKVRETYDLHTVKDRISVIGVHTPGADVIKRNYPGLLMQCKAYRPVSCDVRLACASMLPMDPLGVGTSEGDVAPEDLFNPILYKPMSNFGMSQLDAYINSSAFPSANSVSGPSVDCDYASTYPDDFAVYYGLLSQTHDWRHANPQAGLSMSSLRPLVYETYETIGDNTPLAAATAPSTDPADTFDASGIIVSSFRGSSHPMPMLNCTYPVASTKGYVDKVPSGFTEPPQNNQIGVPAPKVFVGCIIVPPSRLHQLFYRLVCEWTLEFSSIRPISEITSFAGLAGVGNNTHFMSYNFEAKSLSEDTMMVDTTGGSDIKRVM